MPPNWQNIPLFHGDDLTFLRALSFESVELIATDSNVERRSRPSRDPGQHGHRGPVSGRLVVEKRRARDWVDKITGDFPHVTSVIQGSPSSHGDDMGASLNFMGVPRLETRRVLKPTDSIHLHCHPMASHY